ncbi:uncharacterized protein LOC128033940 [Gossypium raimondii]|uniref:uncharacterized protein LOC128033940 n=1 Tax=Gossypium raimondii TaxID=29730 RepID=UPI00227A552F|nr:uncharacterized protein LOC128033940 [Gossypium raimondii]
MDFGLNSERVLCFRGRICVPNDTEFRQSILSEAHSSPYAMHPGRNKMYRDLRESYWWSGLKQEVTKFVPKCLTCHQVKAEHQLPSGLLQPVKILFRKWERVTMDFISGLPLTPTKKDSVWAASDRQKSYADLKRREIEYSMGDFIFLRVSPWKKHYRSDPTHIVSVEEIEVRPDLTFEEESVQILDRDVKFLRRKSIPLVKVLWRNRSTKQATWKPEDAMRQQNNMYRDLCELYWWPGLKREAIEFVAKCLTCQQVKAEHQLPSGLLQPVKIPLWK